MYCCKAVPAVVPHTHDLMQVSATYNSTAAIIVHRADGQGVISELRFETVQRLLQLCQAVDGGQEAAVGSQPIQRTAGSELRGFRARLVDEQGEVVDESDLKVVLRYDGDQRVSQLQHLACLSHCISC